MSAALHLVITTPGAVLVDVADVTSIRAEDDSGCFGIHPGHADLITVVSPSVVRWRSAAAAKERFCVVLGGVLTVDHGRRVAIACREGVLGDDLHGLEAEVQAQRTAETDADHKARVEQMRLQAMAVRQMMRYLNPGANPVEYAGAELGVSTLQAKVTT